MRSIGPVTAWLSLQLKVLNQARVLKLTQIYYDFSFLKMDVRKNMAIALLYTQVAPLLSKREKIFWLVLQVNSKKMLLSFKI